MMDVSELFSRLRHDERTHLGLGDIRLTVGDQQDIADEIQRLRCQSCQCGEDEACKFVQEIEELRKELSTAKSQLYNYNIAIREALRRVDGFEWITESEDEDDA